MHLFLISALSLFLELVAIRWFGSTVVFLTFFTNVVLLATFLGMSVGCLASSAKRDLTGWVVPLILVGVSLAVGVLFVYERFGQVMIDVGGQGSPQQIYFGTEYRARDVSRFVVPLEVVAGTFFVVISLVFVGIGQILGRAFTAMPNRIAAYTVNIVGGLTGLSGFALLSYLRTPPAVWFAVALVLALVCVSRWTATQIGAAAVTLALVVLAPQLDGARLWSPYYKIAYDAPSGLISTNNISHQQMMHVADTGVAYLLPHLLNRDAGNAPFADVLVIGAGSGNDVAAALAQGAAHVDAVEIDPVIQRIGRDHHPDRPYADPRVTVHIDDGRSFLRRSNRQYDLIVYALVDSLVLQSGFASVRLESFLFTREAFADIRAHLKPGGVFAAYNSYRQGWLVGRLAGMMRDVFARPPLVASLPYRARITPEDRTDFNVFLAGANSARLDRIERALEAEPFWMNRTPRENAARNGFSAVAPVRADAPAASWLRIGLTHVAVRRGERAATDDWPFVYLRDRTVPSLNVRGVALIGVLSVALLLVFAPAQQRTPNWRMFFLGAGFMLIETKSVVHMALLFGSTWMVNTVVVAAILVMILASNLFVLLVRPMRLWPYYALLVAALAADLAIPMGTYLSLPDSTRVLASCTAVFVPIFFAGIIFATTFRDSREPDWDFGSNLAGAILGGLAETLSLVLGFNRLLMLALLFYVLSAWLGRRGAGYWTMRPPVVNRR